MSQQIINIPINWDDDLFTKAIEKGVVEEVKKEMTKQCMNKLGIDRYSGYTQVFEEVLRECMREVLNEKKEEIVNEIINLGRKSLVNSKDFKEAKAKPKGEIND